MGISRSHIYLQVVTSMHMATKPTVKRVTKRIHVEFALFVNFQAIANLLQGKKGVTVELITTLDTLDNKETYVMR